MITFGQYAFAELPPEYDYSTSNPISALLADPDAQLVHLIELYPYDDALPGTLSGMPPFGSVAFGEFDISYGGGVSRVYFSDMGHITTPTDSQPNIYYPPLVDSPMQFDTSIFSGTDFANGSMSYGSIVIENADAEYDHLSGFQWNGRRAVVKVGAKSFAYSSFATIFDGVVNDYEEDDYRITLTIRDNRIRMDQYIAAPLYEGSGDLEGGENLMGSPKPLCFGEVKNIEPVLVDTATLVYQIHDGSVLGVDIVRDAGVPLTDGGNVSDILSAMPAAGSYVTQNSGGYIKLGSTPAGRITVDCRGSDEGGYVDTAGEIVKRIAASRLSATPFDASTIDDGAFTEIDGELTGPTGIYTATQITASEAIDALLLPCLAYWNFSRQGSLTGGIVRAPSMPVLFLDLDDVNEAGVQILSTIAPSWRISVGYSPLGVVQGEDELAGATSDDDRAFLTSPYRYVTFTDSSIRSRYDLAPDRTFSTRLARRDDAEALLARLQEIYMEPRRLYRVPLNNALYRLFIGDVVSLTYPRFDLTEGKTLTVVSISEDAKTNNTVLGLWG